MLFGIILQRSQILLHTGTMQVTKETKKNFQKLCLIFTMSFYDLSLNYLSYSTILLEHGEKKIFWHCYVIGQLIYLIYYSASSEKVRVYSLYFLFKKKQKQLKH